MTMLRFERADTLGAGWTLNVLKGERGVARIQEGADGRYRLYRGAGGVGSPLMQQPLAENADLEALKRWAESNL